MFLLDGIRHRCNPRAVPLAFWFLCGGCLAPGAALRHREGTNRTDRPNFVLFFVDDLGYGDTGFTGSHEKTPNIDRLAKGGRELQTWYSGCPICSGSRAALLTGRQFTRIGIAPGLPPSTPGGLPLSEITIAEHLKMAGYATAIVGKWHLGARRVHLPANQGFDSFLGIPYSCDMGRAQRSKCGKTIEEKARLRPAADSNVSKADSNVSKEAETEPPHPSDQHENLFGDEGDQHLPLVEQAGSATRVLAQPLDFTTLGENLSSFAVNFIKMHADRPFFLYVPFTHVHVTLVDEVYGMQYAGCRFRGQSSRGGFGDALLEVDWMIGNIHQALVEYGVESNTLILFTGDNGPWLGKGDAGGSVGPFNGSSAGYWNVGKGSTWEGGIREPAFAYWKGKIQPGITDEVVSSLDVFPTFAALAGLPLPTDRVYDGKDMSDVLLQNNGSSKHEILFFYGGCSWTLDMPTAARYGKWKAHFCTGPGERGCHGCKLKVEYKEPLLFNIVDDPAESNPLTTKTHPEVRPVIKHFQEAFTMEAMTFHYGNRAQHEPEEPGEGPGKYGVCCNRDNHCFCPADPTHPRFW